MCYTRCMEWDELIKEFEKVLRELESTMTKDEFRLFLISVYKVLYNGG